MTPELVYLVSASVLQPRDVGSIYPWPYFRLGPD